MWRGLEGSPLCQTATWHPPGPVLVGQEVEEGARCVREGREAEAGKFCERILSFLAT